MRSPSMLVAMAATLALWAGASFAQQGPPGPRHMYQCPAAVPGTKVVTADVEGGIALIFTTTGDVNELQRRARAMATHHNHRQHMGGRGRGPGRGPGMGLGPPANMPIATRTVQDLPTGTRIIVKPDDPTRLEALRQSVRAYAQSMQKGTCPMMKARPEQAEQ